MKSRADRYCCVAGMDEDGWQGGDLEEGKKDEIIKERRRIGSEKKEEKNSKGGQCVRGVNNKTQTPAQGWIRRYTAREKGGRAGPDSLLFSLTCPPFLPTRASTA